MALGHGKGVVDIDQSLIFTRRKQRQEQKLLHTESDPLPKRSTVKFTLTG